MQFVKDQKTEVKLHSKNIPFEFMKVRFGDIDLEEGLRRQARMIAGKLNEDAVFQMASDMEKEDAAFPACLLQKPPGKGSKLWPWAGNHRLNAFSLNHSPDDYINAYVVTVRDPVMLDMLPRIMNAMESSLGFSKEERVFQARYAINTHGWPVAFAAEEFGVKPEWIYNKNSEEAVKKIIADLPGAENLSSATLKKLHPLADNVNVVRAIVALFLKYNVKGDRAYHCIAEVRQARTELQRMAELGKWDKLLKAEFGPAAPPPKAPPAEEPAKPKGRKPAQQLPSQIRISFIKSLMTLRKILEKANSRTKLQLTNDTDFALVKAAWAEVIRPAMDNILKGE